MDGSASMASGLLRIKIAPHFDEPYLSASFADWWSRRWNLTVGNVLRMLIYDPIVEGERKQHRVRLQRKHTALGTHLKLCSRGPVAQASLQAPPAARALEKACRAW